MQNATLEQSQQIRGADGSLLWAGAQVIGIPYVGRNDAAAAMLMGEGVRWNNTASAASGQIPRQETTAAGATPSSDLPQSLVVALLRIATTTDVTFLGVATEPVAIGGFGLIAGVGSLATVITTATLLTTGTTVGGSATAGQAAVNTTAAQILGTVFKINSTVAAGGTGSTGFAGILVNPR